MSRIRDDLTISREPLPWFSAKFSHLIRNPSCGARSCSVLPVRGDSPIEERFREASAPGSTVLGESIEGYDFFGFRN